MRNGRQSAASRSQWNYNRPHELKEAVSFLESVGSPQNTALNTLAQNMRCGLEPREHLDWVMRNLRTSPIFFELLWRCFPDYMDGKYEKEYREFVEFAAYMYQAGYLAAGGAPEE